MRDGPARAHQARGFALIIVLWTVVLLTVIATQLTAAGRAEVRLASNLRGAAAAQAAADGCVYEAVLRLLDPGTPWPPGPGPRPVRVAGGQATVQVGSEDGKLDLNSVPADMLGRLLRALGVDGATAQQLALDVVLWRFPSAQTIARVQAYAQAGRDYGPPGASFQSVSELALVLGMTPAILARLGPHVTVYHDGDPDPRVADPLVRGLLGVEGAASPSRDAAAGEVADIDAVVQMDGGSRASRHAVVRVGSQTDRGGWKILVWE